MFSLPPWVKTLELIRNARSIGFSPSDAGWLYRLGIDPTKLGGPW